MTTMQLDQDRPDLDTRVYARAAHRWWAAALGGFLVGVLAVVAVTSGRPAPAEPAPPARAASVAEIVRFELLGDGVVDFAGVWSHPGPQGQVSTFDQIQATHPYTAVLTVRADRGKRATCRIYADDRVIAEAIADSGSSATCVGVRATTPS